MLITSNNSPDRWIVPAGGVEAGEEFQDAAIREVLEEVSELEILIINTYPFPENLPCCGIPTVTLRCCLVFRKQIKTFLLWFYSRYLVGWRLWKYRSLSWNFSGIWRHFFEFFFALCGNDWDSAKCFRWLNQSTFTLKAARFKSRLWNSGKSRIFWLNLTCMQPFVDFFFFFNMAKFYTSRSGRFLDKCFSFTFIFRTIRVK